MTEKQEILIIGLEELPDKVRELKNSTYRLVQICCAKSNNLEINYSFDKDYSLLSLRIILDSPQREIPSISAIYQSAFIYENEMHDLFALNVKGISLDYKGDFYRTKIKYPFNPQIDKESA